MTSEVPDPAQPFSARLRAATWGEHDAAASAGYVADLVAGALPHAGYTAMVVQHWFIYQVLEQAAEAIRHDPAATPFISGALARAPALRADLAFLLGPDWAEQVAPSPATTAYLDRMRAVCFHWPAGFLAHHYTRYLGDLSGGQAIRRALERRYGLGDGRGASFYHFPGLGPIGAFKRRYRQRLDALPYDAAERDRMVAEVTLAYRLNRRVFAQLERDRPADPAPPPADTPFPPEVVAQIRRHMNDDHAADSLLIVRALGGRPDAQEVRMSGMDADGIEFTARTGSGQTAVRIPFPRRLTRRSEVRGEVVALYRQACAILGVAPRPSG